MNDSDRILLAFALFLIGFLCGWLAGAIAAMPLPDLDAPENQNQGRGVGK